MNERTLEALAQRLDRLERELRWWRWAGSGLVLLLSVLTLVAAGGTSASSEIKTKRLVIVDDNGQERIWLGNYFGYGLKIIGKNDKTRISLQEWDDGQVSLTFHENKGLARIEVKLTDKGSPSINLVDYVVARAVLGTVALESPNTGVVEQRPSSSLVFFDQMGKVIWKAP